MEYALLTADTNITLEMDRFWASRKNKELLEILSRNNFVGLTLKQVDMSMMGSGYSYGTIGQVMDYYMALL